MRERGLASRWRVPLLASAVCSFMACSGASETPPSGEDAGASATDSAAPIRDSGSGDSAPPNEDARAPADDASAPDSSVALPSGTPETVALDGARLAALQKELKGGASGTPEQKAAFQNLIAAADGALVAGTWSVTTKSAEFVANNDPHEYASWGPYWWPKDANPPSVPGTQGKCPYGSHDGLRNPSVDKITDRHGLHASSEAIFELAIAWYLTGNTAYADQAARVARAWYLDPATAMKPEMNYAQQQGPCTGGTAAGLIEASGCYMTDALDGLAILALDDRAAGWTAADKAGITAWMKQFATWMTTSAIGKGEMNGANNHGTWYDVLAASIDLFVGDPAAAKTVVNASKTKRIDAQIKSDGSMPQELARTTSWHYSNYNAAAFCRLASVAKHVDVDLWAYQSSGGGSIKKAIAFLIPAATAPAPPAPWKKYNDIESPFDQVYQAESFYSIHAGAEYGQIPEAIAVFAQNPPAVIVPGHYCSGERFPTGSDFCKITPGSAKFEDLQPIGTPSVDMWPILPICRVPIN